MTKIKTIQKLDNTSLEQWKNQLIKKGTKFPIYLDNPATTAVDPRVLEAMLPYFSELYGNPHSKNHSYAWDAEEACEKARHHVANLIGATAKEIIFTSGATESNNMALKGVAKFYGDNKKHIITTVTEHKCVLDTCRHLEQEGFRVTYLPVEKNGIISLDKLSEAICDDTLLVSIMYVNNEIGVTQPLREIGQICRAKKVFFHSDIAQAFGKVPLNVNDCNLDLVSISGHKIYGPKGIGALYIRRKPRIRLTPIFNGGGQERGFRSGTLSPALAVGLGKAAEIAMEELIKNSDHIQNLSNEFINIIQNGAKDVFLNGDQDHRYPGIINLSFAYIEGESMILSLKDLAVSSGSACTSSSLEPSYVLRALGVGDELAHTSIRFGFSPATTEEEMKYAAALVLSKIDKLRELSPLWEMVQDGIDISKIKWSTH